MSNTGPKRIDKSCPGGKPDHLTPHSINWYKRLAQIQNGYYYNWKSIIPKENGENFFINLLQEFIKKDHVVLDACWGHGELTNEIA